MKFSVIIVRSSDPPAVSSRASKTAPDIAAMKMPSQAQPTIHDATSRGRLSRSHTPSSAINAACAVSNQKSAGRSLSIRERRRSWLASGPVAVATAMLAPEGIAIRAIVSRVR